MPRPAPVTQPVACASPTPRARTIVPGEELKGDVQKLKVVPSGEALRLKAIRDFTSEEQGEVYAGDEWLFEGPGTYYPRVDVQVLQTLCAKVIMPNQALRLRARKACTDRKGTARSAGEEWLMRETGAYMPGIDEEVVGVIQAYVLTEHEALHLRATRTFVDQFLNERKVRGPHRHHTTRQATGPTNSPARPTRARRPRPPEPLGLSQIPAALTA